MMTKKHFEMIAKIAKIEKLNRSVIERFAVVFADENPLFDKARFIKACYWEPFIEDEN